jgi:hypothetical protein
VVDDVSIFSSASLNYKEARDIYGASKQYPGNVTQHNTTANTPTNAYSSVNIASQLDQNRAELRTALNNPFNAATTQKKPQKLSDNEK